MPSVWCCVCLSATFIGPPGLNAIYSLHGASISVPSRCNVCGCRAAGSTTATPPPPPVGASVNFAHRKRRSDKQCVGEDSTHVCFSATQTRQHLWRKHITHCLCVSAKETLETVTDVSWIPCAVTNSGPVGGRGQLDGGRGGMKG